MSGLDSQGTVADGPIWPFHWAYSTAQKNYTHNVEAATLRLDAAGLRLPKARRGRPHAEPVPLQVPDVAKNATYEKIALLLQKQLYEIGVDMEIETRRCRSWDARVNHGKFDAILAERISGRSLVWTYLVFHSSKNSAALQGGRRDARPASLGTSTDAEVQTNVSDLQQIFHDDPPAIFFAWPQVARVVSTKFSFPTSPDPRRTRPDVINTIWKWHVDRAK